MSYYFSFQIQAQYVGEEINADMAMEEKITHLTMRHKGLLVLPRTIQKKINLSKRPKVAVIAEIMGRMAEINLVDKVTKPSLVFIKKLDFKDDSLRKYNLTREAYFEICRQKAPLITDLQYNEFKSSVNLYEERWDQLELML